MHRPHCHELSEPDAVRAVIVPEPHRQNAGIICELDFDVSLCRSVLLAGFGDIVEVHDAAHESKIARTRLEAADIRFFIVKIRLP